MSHGPFDYTIISLQILYEKHITALVGCYWVALDEKNIILVPVPTSPRICPIEAAHLTTSHIHMCIWAIDYSITSLLYEKHVTALVGWYGISWVLLGGT